MGFLAAVLAGAVARTAGDHRNGAGGGRCSGRRVLSKSDPAFYLLFGGTLGGHSGGCRIAAWRLLEPIPSLYRRGGLAIVSAFATVLLMLVCIPVNQMFGATGLLVTMGLSGIAAALLAARSRRLAAESMKSRLVVQDLGRGSYAECWSCSDALPAAYRGQISEDDSAPGGA